MYIDTNYFVFIDIAIILFLFINVFKGVKEGFLTQIVNLLGLIAAIILAKIFAPIFAELFDLWPHSWYIANQMVFDALVYDAINNLVWFILLVIVLKVIFMLFKPLAKFIGSIPLIKQVNKVLGIISGSVIGIIWLFIIYMIMASPLIINNQDVINQTYFKVFDQVTMAIMNEQAVNDQLWKQWIDEDLSNDSREDIKQWLIDHNVDDLPIEEFTQGANNE
ncbi:MAG: CvpA family protein [Erysipelotrichaceae bacterium]|nr:CvpA family protein [Erysipelotrichaceae bacterium]MDY5252346.1 CvpA family protein [Erysipelotrichaceae bacterium]